MPYLSSKIEPAQVHIYNFKRLMFISALPATKNDSVYDTIKRVYPQMRLSKNILENNFYNYNPCSHAQLCIPKAAFFFERAKVFRVDIGYFFTPMEALAEVVGIDVPVTKAMTEILRVFTDFDYRAHGVTLKGLGIEGLGKKQILDHATHGRA